MRCGSAGYQPVCVMRSLQRLKLQRWQEDTSVTIGLKLACGYSTDESYGLPPHSAIEANISRCRCACPCRTAKNDFKSTLGRERASPYGQDKNARSRTLRPQMASLKPWEVECTRDQRGGKRSSSLVVRSSDSLKPIQIRRCSHRGSNGPSQKGDGPFHDSYSACATSL